MALTTKEPISLMFVDDEQDITTAIRFGLSRLGFSVAVFNDPLDALAHFEPNRYEVVLLDVKMPRMSGFELYLRLKKVQPDLKVCFFTAFEVYGKELDIMFPELGPNDVIQKPVALHSLASRLESVARPSGESTFPARSRGISRVEEASPLSHIERQGRRAAV